MDCHRFSLVARALKNSLQLEVSHILYDGEIITHTDLEQKMLRLLHVENDMFEDNKSLLEKSYAVLNDKIAFYGGDDIL